METVKFPRLRITKGEFFNTLNKARRANPNTWLQGQVWVEGKYVQFKLHKTYFMEYRVGDTSWDNTSGQTNKQFQTNLRAPFKQPVK
jgi:hypothetical protein